MRDRPRTQAVHPAAPVARIFSPSDLDLDDLAEAIRQLLGPDISAREDALHQPNGDLLSLARRGTHVVGENETR
jgi:hypothetical protein